MDKKTSDYIDSIADHRLVIAFDLYGTLLSTASISKKLSEYFPENGVADSIAKEWRKYQLEYTWRLNSMGTYKPFDEVTKLSLLHALGDAKLKLSDSDVDEVMKAYDNLSTFPDVQDCMEAISQNKHFQPLVFSNGTHKMVTSSIASVKEISSFAKSKKDGYVVVDDVEKYKPHPMVYEYLAAKVGKLLAGGGGDMGEIVLVTGNPFDVVGAVEKGIVGIWLDRSGAGWQDQLGKPTHIISDLKGLVEVLEEIIEKKGWSKK